MKKYLWMIVTFGCVFLIFFFLILFLNNKNSYDIKISFFVYDNEPKKIEEEIVKPIEDEYMMLKGVKDVVCFIKENEFDFYLKLKGFALDRDKTINRVFLKTNLILNNIPQIIKIDFDYEYYVKYDYFLALTAKNDNYFSLDEKNEEVMEELLVLDVSSSIKQKGILDKSIEINLLNRDLQTYDIDFEDLKNLIQKNNSDKNLILKNNENDFYRIKIDSSINDIEDIKNISFFYKNRRFHQRFNDAFDIKKQIDFESNRGMVFKDGKHAIIYALKLDFPRVLSYYKIQKFIKKFNENNSFSLALINPNKKKKIGIFLNKNSNIKKEVELYKKISKEIPQDNNLYFVGLQSPKTKQKQDFSDDEKNEMTIIVDKKDYKKIIDYLFDAGIDFWVGDNFKYVYDFDKENLTDKISLENEYFSKYFILGTQKAIQITYDIDENLMNDNGFQKIDILNTLDASTLGLLADTIKQKDKDYKIILKFDKNEQGQDYIYSKKFKNFVALNALIKKDFKQDFSVISKKNKRYFVKLIEKY